ncbi:MAG: hypothetical protein DCF22_12745 [Leptolyngbya sp.]|nr:MAG: hypothetical protein DCF22_12745 [Leptolyngbya sp.]
MPNKEPEPSDEEGLIDVRIIRALYRSVETGSFVQLDQLDRDRRPTLAQSVNHEATQEKPDLIRVADPAGKS